MGQSSATPSPYRTPLPVLGTHQRSEWEQEMWNDLANVVFFASLSAAPGSAPGTVVCPLSIPCPVRCRLDITAHAMSTLTGDWSAYIRVNGTNTYWSEIQRQSAGTNHLATWIGCPDLNPGTHTIDIILLPTVPSDFFAMALKVRRGRTPPA